jgi:hypothetical protein
MATPSRFDSIVRTITKDVIEHPRDLTRHYAESLGITRVAQTSTFNALRLMDGSHVAALQSIGTKGGSIALNVCDVDPFGSLMYTAQTILKCCV